MTFVDVIAPPALRGRNRALGDVTLALGGSAAIALSAQLAVPLPFTPVPLTGQTFAVLLVGALLGARKSGLALVFYLLEGAAGLPVFAWGRAGIAPFLGPTAGYLVGFVPAAMLVGFLAERGWDRKVGTMFLAMLLGTAVIHAVGLANLARFVPSQGLLATSLVPFLAGDLIKAILAALALPHGWKWIGRSGDRSV